MFVSGLYFGILGPGTELYLQGTMSECWSVRSFLFLWPKLQ